MRCRGTTESRPSDGACWIGCTWRSIATWTDCSSPSAYGWQAETSHRSRSGKGLQKREQNPRFESYNGLQQHLGTFSLTVPGPVDSADTLDSQGGPRSRNKPLQEKEFRAT